MKVLVIYAHPNPNSFNHAILERVTKGLKVAGHEVKIKDLYAMNWDPVFRLEEFVQLSEDKVPEAIRREQEDVLWAEGLVFIYPVWWYTQPAILKGWIDKVFIEGFAFGTRPDGTPAKLPAKKALVICTTGGEKEAYVQYNNIPLLKRPLLEGTLGLCGVADARMEIFFGVPSASDDERQTMLDRAEELARNF